MNVSRYAPEGKRLFTDLNREYISSKEGIRRAAEEDAILEGKAILCDAKRNLMVDLAGRRGVIPKEETAYIAGPGEIRDIAIISQVGKPVCFKVLNPELPESGDVLLSRRAAQEEATRHFLNTLRPGDVIPAKVTHLEHFGAFVDIGCGVISLIGIENISISRISHPSERFTVGKDIFAAVLDIDRESRRLNLTHKELLGTWEENAALFSVGETVVGTVRGVESYGSFVELAPNLSGLCERKEGMKTGDRVSAYIKAISPENMKCKLVIIENFGKEGGDSTDLTYFISDGHIDRWRYSPESCKKKVLETVFQAELI